VISTVCARTIRLPTERVAAEPQTFLAGFPFGTIR
jgi:hypothetical protein